MQGKSLLDIVTDFKDDVSSFYDAIVELGEARFLFWDEQLSAWIVTGYRESLMLLRSDHVERKPFMFQRYADVRANEMLSAAEKIMDMQMISMNGTAHLSTSKYWSSILNSELKELSSTSEQFARDLLNECGGRQIDFYRNLLRPFVVRTIQNKLRVLPREMIELKNALECYVGFFDGSLIAMSEPFNAARAIVEIFTKLWSSTPQRKVALGESNMENIEWLSNFVLVLVAGHESTAYLLGTILVECQHLGNIIEVLSADVSRLSAFVDEGLRFDAPVQLIGRFARTDIELNGNYIRAGDRLLIHIGAANRDPRVFDDPHIFKVGRSGPSNLAFGVGDGRCIGVAHTRIQAMTMLQVIVNLCSDISVEIGSISRIESLAGREFSYLAGNVSLSK
jgi:cytochrome P450